VVGKSHAETPIFEQELAEMILILAEVTEIVGALNKSSR
jgi:hypothetical protein